MTIPGDGVSHTVSIYEDYTLHQAIFRCPGRDLTEYLMKNLTEQGVSFTAAAQREIAREVKEKLRCFGADDDTELKSTAEIGKEKTHELPQCPTKVMLCLTAVILTECVMRSSPSAVLFHYHRRVGDCLSCH